MTTYTQLLYQIVFGTKFRKPTLTKPHNEDLHKYICKLLENKNCHPYRIGGVEDHIHIVTHIHPTLAISPLIKDIKLATTDFIKRNHFFPTFEGWQDGYGLFSYSMSAKDNLIEYVKNQEEHHKKTSFETEYIALLNENEITPNPKYPI